MSKSTKDAQKQLQALSDEYTKLQTDLESNVSARRKLDAQQHENENVQREFQILKDSANIYKLIGPAMVKQDKSEAVSAVEGRLEFIRNEIKRFEQHIKTLQEKSESKKMEIYQLQTEMQAQGAQQQGQVAAK